MTTEPSSTFTFVGHTWSPKKAQATFMYEIKHKDESFTFSEVLTLSQSIKVSEVPEALLKNIFENISLVLGISYYKLFCPTRIVINTFTLTKDQAGFWNTVYIKGLGEFFYTNQIDFRGLVSFPFEAEAVAFSVAFSRQDRSLVGIGGGKDSIVAGELLKAHAKSFTAFIVNTHPIKEKIVELLGVDQLVIKRELDPVLFELNKRSDTYNGHVPVSAQLAFLGLVTAVLYDYRYVIMANEESASYGSTEYLGENINHQWSKSLEFERLFQEYSAAFITPDVQYFSLLRPLSELAIAKQLLSSPQYLGEFSSCNTNFKLTGKTEKKWCGSCPKCAFTFSLLAVFLPKEQVIGIFGKNLFAEAGLIQTYKELLGITAIKPFDCVGTPEEVQAAFSFAMQAKEYENDPVMIMFMKEVFPKITDVTRLQNEVLEVSGEHRIPEPFQDILKI